MSDAVAETTAKTAKGGMSALSKKIGPLPVGAWIGVIAVGVLIAYTVNSRAGTGTRTSNTLAVADDGTTGPEPNVGDGSVGGWQYQQATAAQAAKTYDTNEKWGRAAIQFLIGQGYDAALADVAIRRYLGGLSISVQQRPLITAAIAGLGPTPEQMNPIDELPTDSPVTGGDGTGSTGGGSTNNPPPTPPRNNNGLFGWLFGLVDAFLPGLNIRARNLIVPVNGQDYSVSVGYGADGGSVSVTDPNGAVTDVSVPRTSTNPATTVPPAPGSQRTYTVKEGDTLPGIAMAMYGSSLQASKIYNANLSKITDKDRLVAGTVLVIPE